MDTLRQDIVYGFRRLRQAPGLRPALGRGFRAGENDTGKHRVAVLGHRLWRERFGADPGVVGQTVQLDRDSYVVVGVAPSGFSYPEGTDLWRPLEHDEVFRSRSRGAWYLGVIGRLRPGVPLAQAREEVSVGATFRVRSRSASG